MYPSPVHIKFQLKNVKEVACREPSEQRDELHKFLLECQLATQPHRHQIRPQLEWKLMAGYPDFLKCLIPIPDGVVKQQRSPWAYAFGFGRHQCFGIRLIELSAWLPMASMVAMLDVSKALDNDRFKIEPELVFESTIFRSPNSFKLAIGPQYEVVLRLLADQLTSSANGVDPQDRLPAATNTVANASPLQSSLAAQVPSTVLASMSSLVPKSAWRPALDKTGQYKDEEWDIKVIWANPRYHGNMKVIRLMEKKWDIIGTTGTKQCSNLLEMEEHEDKQETDDTIM
ncbi:hypothetical protein OG21DRAFT_1525484 [Imleria badia]|nr:hypothetical protein OG21DRAFT_1525484 [Imleria badia]